MKKRNRGSVIIPSSLYMIYDTDIGDPKEKRPELVIETIKYSLCTLLLKH
jgi:hypothetical protein